MKPLNCLLLVIWLLSGPAAADGVEVGEASSVRKLVPAAALERQAAQEYEQLKRQAASKGALAPPDHPQSRRLRAIAARLVGFAPRFNEAAGKWRWEVILIGSPELNAFCMPGGKIAVYSGLLSKLQLSDDEVAIVMGHEIAHALREHARERVAKNELTGLGIALLSEYVGKGKYQDLFQVGGNLLTLKFSRDDEQEADLVGLDLAARAGFNPEAGVSLWQKMLAHRESAPPAWLSTHPSGENRIEEIRQHLPEVMPLYEAARVSSRDTTGPERKAPGRRPSNGGS